MPVWAAGYQVRSCNIEIHSSLFPQANTPWTVLKFCQTEGKPASPTLAGSVFFCLHGKEVVLSALANIVLLIMKRREEGKKNSLKHDREANWGGFAANPQSELFHTLGRPLLRRDYQSLIPRSDRKRALMTWVGNSVMTTFCNLETLCFSPGCVLE